MITFLESHWIEIEDGSFVIGVHEEALDEITPLTEIQLPEVDSYVGSDRSFGEVIGEQSSINLYSPFSGTIIEVNDILIENPDTLLDDPYGESWLVRIEPDKGVDLSETQIKAVEELILEEL
ncbi:MAG: glycine cleavage system protein H [Bdellovibrionales bacterium]|nr:glycine cleavage system protein H [Bdellovibrionales bacterium]